MYMWRHLFLLKASLHINNFISNSRLQVFNNVICNFPPKINFQKRWHLRNERRTDPVRFLPRRRPVPVSSMCEFRPSTLTTQIHTYVYIVAGNRRGLMTFAWDVIIARLIAQSFIFGSPITPQRMWPPVSARTKESLQTWRDGTGTIYLCNELVDTLSNKKIHTFYLL